MTSFAVALRARLTERRSVIDPIYREASNCAARIAACDARWNPAFSTLLRDAPSDTMLRACAAIVHGRVAEAVALLGDVVPVIDPIYQWIEFDLSNPDVIRDHVDVIAVNDWRVSRNAHLLGFLVQVRLRLQAAAVARAPLSSFMPIAIATVVDFPVVPRADVPADFECFICMESGADNPVSRMPSCIHTAHRACLMTWYMAHPGAQPSCAVCSQTVVRPVIWAA